VAPACGGVQLPHKVPQVCVCMVCLRLRAVHGVFEVARGAWRV
jgi:hypothetical protein